MTAFTLKLPKHYPQQQKILECKERDVAIECAPCTRVPETMLAWLFREALAAKGTYLLISARPTPHRERLAQWLKPATEAGWATKRAWGWEFSSGARLMLWPAESLESAPVTSIDAAVILEADECPDPLLWLAQHAPKFVRACGSLAGPSHWFAKQCRKLEKTPAYFRVTADEALTAGVVKAETLAEIKSRMPAAAYARIYGLSDQSADAVVPFLTFARQRLQIRDKEGQIIPFTLRSIQRTYVAYKRMIMTRLRAKGLPAKFLLLKYRRGGFTTCEQAQSYYLVSTRANQSAVTLAHTDKDTSTIFRIAQLMHRRDPHAPRLKGVGNAQRLDFPDLNSTFGIGTAGSSGFGRGDTLQRVHGSEVSKWGKGPGRIETVRDLVAGLTEAASHGEVVLETTPNGNEWFCQTYKAAEARQNDWTPIFLPWFLDPTYRMAPGTFDPAEIRDALTDRERELIARHGLAFDQLAWRRMKVKGLGALMAQEYPEDSITCFLMAGTIFFDAARIIELIESTPEYITTPIGSYGYEVEWQAPVTGEYYIAGIDTSEGIPGEKSSEWYSGEGASDPCGIGILKASTGEQVAAVHGIFTPAELAQHAKRICERYNGALAAVERNNHGHAVIGKLTDGESSCYYTNLYYAEDDRAGWPTNAQTRPVMLSDFREAVDEGHVVIRDRHMLQECMVFKKQRDGNWRAESPDHDDCLFKWMIAWQARKRMPAKSEVIVLGK